MNRLLTSLALILAAGYALAQDSNRPRLAIPKLTTIPVVDGKLSAGEWDQATAVSGFLNAGSGLLMPDTSRIFLGHDGERIYMAIACELPPGVKPSMNYRRRDEPVYMDRYQLELWLTPPAYGGQVAGYQMIGNAYGAIYDSRHVPQLGQITSGWNGNWEFVSTYETGKIWTAELSIPFSDLLPNGVAWDPEEPWGGLVAVAWPQRSWPHTGGWYKNINNHALMTMQAGANCVRIDDLSALFQNRLDARLTLVNAGPEAGDFTVEAKVGEQSFRRTVSVPAGTSLPVQLEGELTNLDAKRNTLHLAVTDPTGLVLIAGDWHFIQQEVKEVTRPETQETPAWSFSSRLKYAPEGRGVYMWADVLDYPQRDQLAEVTFAATAKGSETVIVSESVRDFDYDAAETYLWLPEGLAPGDYVVNITFRDAAGAVLLREEKGFAHVNLADEFHWYGNDLYEKLQVHPPFEPITVTGSQLSVWGRDYRFVGGFPEQISSLGAELLAAPIRLVAIVDGNEVPVRQSAPFALTGNDGSEATFTGQFEAAGITFELQGSIAFDGTLSYEMTVRPGADGVALDRLYLAMPVKPEHATTFYSTAGGWDGGYGFVPDEPAAQPFWSSDELSDFVPYVGLTDDHRALQWFADHAHDWVLGEAPTATLTRTANAVELQVNLVQAPTTLREPLKMPFGFIATPVKPIPKGWRHTTLHFGNIYDADLQFFYGPGHGGCPIDPHDSVTLAAIHGIDVKEKDADRVLAERTPGKPTIDQLRAKLSSSKVDQMIGLMKGESMRGGNCFFFNAQMYFEGHRSRAFRTLFHGDWELAPSSGWFHLTPTESFRDFFTFHMDMWAKHWFLPGLYFDEVYITQDRNVFNGNGKRMPDGTVRPTVPLMKQRALMQRMWQVFFANDLDPFIWVHTSNFMAPHAISVADIAMYGEDRAPTRTSDYIDVTPAVLMRSIGRGQKFGFIPVWMDQAGRGSGNLGTTSRQLYGWCWIHDVVPEYHTGQLQHPMLGLRVAWGIANDHVTFQPYWQNPAITSSDDEIIVSSWTQPDGKVLLQVYNLKHEAATADLTLDPAALGLPAGYKVYDLESQPAYAAYKKAFDTWLQSGDSQTPRDLLNQSRQYNNFAAYNLPDLTVLPHTPTLKLPIPPRDFRLLLAQ